jgi:spore coat polysaccharide biosynthesis protein SpsF (cytidylyltransferase family)
MIGIVIQARTGSNRLPGKIFMDLNGKHSVQRILEGCSKTIMPNKIILAMPGEDKDKIEIRIAQGELDGFADDRFELFIGDGDQNDLVNRYYKVARKFGLDVIMRITADCPAHCATSKIMDEMLMEYVSSGAKGYMGNNLLTCSSPYPNGVDLEIISYEALCYTKLHAKDRSDLEHVVPFLYGPNCKYPISTFQNLRPHTMVSTKIKDFSLDTARDYEVLKAILTNYDKYQDLNKALENTDITGFDKTNMSKNFKDKE